MDYSETAVDLIQKWEGWHPTWYDDIGGTPTIGYGFTKPFLAEINLDGVKGPLTEEEGATLVRAGLEQHFLPKLSRSLTMTPPQSDVDALCSLVWNIGLGNFDRSTVRRCYNERDLEGARTAFRMWKKDTNPDTGELEVVDGLVARREDEIHVARHGVMDDGRDGNPHTIADKSQLHEDVLNSTANYA